MEKAKIEEIIDRFQTTFDKYHKLFFLEYYPLFSTKQYDFGSREMNDLGMKCQAYLSMLGPTAKARMNFIGFRQLFAFDNEVDWYSWKIWINENKISHTQYLSISMRIDTELKRMRLFLSENMWDAYCSLNEDEFSVSYLTYEDFQEKTLIEDENELRDEHNLSTKSSNIQLIVNNHPEKIEEQFFSNIEHLEKRTSILANIATFVARVSGIKL